MTSSILSYEDACQVLDVQSYKQAGKKRSADECLQVQFQLSWKDDFLCTDWFPFSLPDSLMEQTELETQQEEIVEEEVVEEFSTRPSPSKAQQAKGEEVIARADLKTGNQELKSSNMEEHQNELDSKAISDEDQRTAKDEQSDIQDGAQAQPKKRGRKPKPKSNDKVEINREFSPQSIPEDQVISVTPKVDIAHDNDTIGIGKDPFYFGLRFGDPIELLYLEDDEFYNAFAMFYSASSDKTHWNLYVTYDGFLADTNENLNLADPETLRRIRPYTGKVKIIETVAYYILM
jgi:hypothetical protein